MIKRIIMWLRRKLRGRVYYIGGPETLPPPLSAEEEEKVLSEIKAGIGGAREKLITRNLRLVVYIAKKFEASYSVEDLISIGNIGLIKAVSTYDPDKNIKLATYASRCIENEILMFLRKTARGKGEVSIDESLNTDSDGNELLLSDVLGTDPDCASQDIENRTEKELLRCAVGKLPPREKMIMELRFGLSGGGEKTQKEVADMIGISQSYISRIEKRTVKTLKRELERQL